MFFHRRLILLISVLLGCTLAYSIRKCGRSVCRDDQVCCVSRDDQVCCVNRNATTGTCCKPAADNYYSNIAVVTRKLSGVLIMLLLFAAGYFIQRMLCSRARQSASPPNRLPPVTTSQEMLMECRTPDGFIDPAPVPQLPRYDDCKLPTYEETMRDGSRGSPASSKVTTRI